MCRRARPGSGSLEKGGRRLIAAARPVFQGHVTMLELPLVVLLQQDRTHEAPYRSLVVEDADYVGAALHLLVQPLDRVGAVQLRPV